MTVPIYAKVGGSRRNYRKSDYCYYCEKEITSKIARHYIQQHADRHLVQKVITDGSDRKILLYKLQQLGNYRHNTQVRQNLQKIFRISNCKIIEHDVCDLNFSEIHSFYGYNIQKVTKL